MPFGIFNVIHKYICTLPKSRSIIIMKTSIIYHRILHMTGTTYHCTRPGQIFVSQCWLAWRRSLNRRSAHDQKILSLKIISPQYKREQKTSCMGYRKLAADRTVEHATSIISSRTRAAIKWAFSHKRKKLFLVQAMMAYGGVRCNTSYS